MTPEETDWQIDHYDASIAYLDDQLGKLFAELRQAGLYDNTIIVITSDHGEAFGEHQLYGHANSLYREEVQVPLIIRYPEKISSGEQVPGNVSLRDLAATVIDLADLKSLQPFPGQSLFDGSREAVIAELYRNPYQPENHPVAHSDLSSIITKDWQAIFMGDKAALYAPDDIGQQYNLAGQEPDKSLLTNLKKELEQNLLSSRHP